jgi:HSP90 family molecular chaperone
MTSLDFQELIHRREVWLASTRENAFDFDILLSGMYHDPSHFIFEILQNAEDAEATYVEFILYQDRLVIIHNGRDFTTDDIEAITGIGNTTKSDDLTTIGKFGIGFKSVFAITQSPVIHSGTYHFEITNFVVPSL